MIRNFWKNSHGNTAILFSLALVPMLVAAGAAVDYERGNRTQTLLQGAVDAAVVGGGAANLTSQAKINTLVENYLAANGASLSLLQGRTIEAKTDPVSGNFHVKVTGKISTNFLSLVGISTMDIGAYSEIEQGGQALEVALVLDNTASMNSEGRLVALKASAKNLVDSLFAQKPAGAYLKVGIVPFADYVNVGMANRHAGWMSVPPDSTTTQNVCNVTYPQATNSNCHDAQGTWNNDGVPTPYTYQVCDWNYGNPTTVCANQTWANTWNGCVGSRTTPLDTKVGAQGQPYPGILNTSCPAPVTDLTDVHASLDSQIDAMNAVGETYIPSGLLWGWNLLDASAPFTTAKTIGQMQSLKGVKSLVLMTDGQNTKSPDYPYHWGSDTALADNITSQLCESIKSQHISVYTVGFKVTAQASIDLLANCASSSSQAFTAADDTALMAAFGQIASSLAQVRITK